MLAPIPGWFTLRAIRLYCRSVTVVPPPIQTPRLSLQNSNPDLPAAVVTHAKQRATSNASRSFGMWKHARASVFAGGSIATRLFVFAFVRA